MDERKFIKKCKELVRNYYNDRVESTDKNEYYLDAYKKWQNVCIEM